MARGVRRRPASRVPPPPWPRMSYDEAMLRFGSDRPDRRFGLELADVSDALRGSEFRVFESVLGGGGVVRALNAGAREMSRSELDGLNDVVRRHGGKAVAYAFVENGALALADREVLLRRAAGRGHRGARRLRGRPAAVRRRRAADRRRGARRAAARARPPLRADPGGHATTSSGSSTSRCSSARRGRALGRGAPSVHGAEGLVRGPRSDALPRLRPRRRRLGARRRVDPHQHARGPARGLQGHRPGRGGGRAALRLPARRAEVRRPAARRHRDGDRPRRGA